MHLAPDAYKIMANAEELAGGDYINRFHIMLGLDLFLMESGQESKLSDADRDKAKELARLATGELNEKNI